MQAFTRQFALQSKLLGSFYVRGFKTLPVIDISALVQEGKVCLDISPLSMISLEE